MCGIYGFQVVPGKELSLYESTVLAHTMATQMEMRGKDSFGSITLPDGKMYKGLGRVSERGRNLLKAASESTCFLAHTRAATVGEVSIENCHPFDIGDVIGVHNGHISNYKELNSTYGRDCKVDSEHVFYHLNEGLPLTDIEGYGVFFWVRKSGDPNTLYFARTAGGSLTVARLYRDDQKTEPVALVWASEAFALRKAAGVLGLIYSEYEITHETIFEVSNGVITTNHEPFVFKPWSNTNSSNNNNSSKSGYNFNRWNRLEGCGLVEDLEEEDTDADNIYTFPRNSSHSNFNANVSGDDDNDDNSAKVILPSDDVITRGLLWVLSSRDCNKRERKAIKRRIAYFKNKNKSRTKEPYFATLHNGVGLKRHYVRPANAVENEVVAVYHCPSCSCGLNNHLWGWCMNDIKAACGAKINAGCDVPYVNICCDCGHYLIDGIHSLDPKHNVVVCRECQDYCVPESKIIKPSYEPETSVNDDVVLAEGIALALTEPIKTADELMTTKSPDEVE